MQALQVIEHILPGLDTVFVGPPPDLLPLEQVKEALCYGVVMTVPTAAHRASKIVSLEE